jgi:NAD dependent epimerase/dehydratase family
MKIVVIGGSGLIGTKLVNKLRQKGHEVVAASPASGVNTITGEGLSEALAGAQVVVDVANSPSFEDKAALGSSSRRLAAIFWPRKRPPVWSIISRCRSSAPTGFKKAAISARRWPRRS